MLGLLNVFLCFSGIFIKMPPKKRSRAGFLNYSKRKERKDIRSTDESNIYSGRGTGCGVRGRSEVEVGSGEMGVGSGEVGVGSGEMGVGSGEVGVGSGEVGVESGEVRVEGDSSGELMAGTGSEQTRGDSDDEYDSTVKRVRIDDVRAMAAEPINEWLDNLPRDDVQHMALLLYANPKNLVFRKPIQLLS